MADTHIAGPDRSRSIGATASKPTRWRSPSETAGGHARSDVLSNPFIARPIGGWQLLDRRVARERQRSGTERPDRRRQQRAALALAGVATLIAGPIVSALIAAPSSPRGAAYVYDGPGPLPPASPTVILSAAASLSTGTSVAVSTNGEVALVGAPDASSSEGAVYVFDRTRSGWSVAQTIDGTSGAGSYFGLSVALSGDGRVALVGAPLAGTGSPQGDVEIYSERKGRWSLTATLDSPAGRGADFGQAVALSANGRVALVGAPYAGAAAGSADGAAELFVESRGRWTPAELLGAPHASGDAFGFSVDLSATGDVAIAGAPFARSRRGQAEIFTASRGRWWLTHILTGPSTSPGQLGTSVALSADGSVAVAGAPAASRGEGVAYVFGRTQRGWAPLAVLRGTTRSPGAGGSAVALAANGAAAAVGAPAAGAGDGAIELYQASAGSWDAARTWVGTAGSGAHLGSSLALSGDGGVMLAGAPGMASGAARLATGTS